MPADCRVYLTNESVLLLAIDARLMTNTMAAILGLALATIR